ncbi:MAG: hypothetical protein M3015_15375 [Bacteroidota bacterium]|nr:hypothetical protein [Bacteroidota bacterium]
MIKGKEVTIYDIAKTLSIVNSEGYNLIISISSEEVGKEIASAIFGYTLQLEVNQNHLQNNFT